MKFGGGNMDRHNTVCILYLKVTFIEGYKI